MNNKEFTAALAAANEMSKTKSAELLKLTVEAVRNALVEGDSVNVANFGLLEVKKKNERLSVNPLTGVRTLVPPKLALAFKPSARLKSIFKDKK